MKNEEISRREFLGTGVRQGIEVALNVSLQTERASEPKRASERRLRLRTGSPLNIYGHPLGGPFSEADSRMTSAVRKTQITNTLQLALSHETGPAVLSLLEFQKDHWGPWTQDHRSALSRIVLRGHSALLMAGDHAEESGLGPLSFARFTPWGALLVAEKDGYLGELNLQTMLFRKHLAVGALNIQWMKWILKEKSRYSFYFVGRDPETHAYWLFRYDPARAVDLKRENENANLLEQGTLCYSDFRKKAWHRFPDGLSIKREPYAYLRENAKDTLASFSANSKVTSREKIYFDGIWLERDDLETRVFI